MYGISERCKGLDKHYRYNPTEKDEVQTGVSFTNTDRRRRGLWTIAKE